MLVAGIVVRIEHSVAESRVASRSGETSMFQAQSILIVEDEPFIGFELAEVVHRRGGHAIGPIPTVAEALALLDNTAIDAAILDVQLLDRDITPVVLQLIVMRTPIIILTGTGLPEALHSTGIALPVVTKPTAPEKIVDLLSAEMKKRPLG